ncbi:glucokinase [Candidatus Aerophobetes bacterium]|uniref:Glucokinase n=1 Tax=Aerophobetes bacterium TaxID=2030807 RepID=A0A2A4X6A9_UNCAE|nr:MAG: glucokinase [Candidatus Aerophobetes bacterium]
MSILAGDIGGTKTHLAFFEQNTKGFVIVAEKKYPSHEHGSLEEIVVLFLQEHAVIAEKACFGIAGAVKHGVCHATNLPWEIEVESLAKACQVGKEKVAIINDLESNAWGIKALDEKDFKVLNQGVPEKKGNQALISAGTGLGEAGIIFMQGKLYPFASEGGHADFAPRNAQEDSLLKYLRKKWNHVSYERVLSGPGIANVHAFLVEDQKMDEEAQVLSEMKEQDAAFVISKWALEKKSDVCVKALEIFSSIYASAAGNLALKMMATGGLFIGGGIAPKILPFLNRSQFLDAFKDKGRFEAMLKDVPIKVILKEETALLGAMVFARDMLD